MGSVRNIAKTCALPSLSLLLLVAAGPGCAAGRKSGEPCGLEEDCQAELTCFANECTPPGACPNKAPVNCGDGSCCPQAFPSCCDDGNCYGTPAECKAATCTPVGKSCILSTDCCAGIICSGGTCKAPADVTHRMTWNITNNCLTGGTVQYRFFDRITRAALSNVATLAAGASVAAGVNCKANRLVCFGGRDTKDSSYYGWDVDGAKDCTGCCMLCEQKSVTWGPLTCP